jgi:hypothetical protein
LGRKTPLPRVPHAEVETTGDLRRPDLVRVVVASPKIDDVRLSSAVATVLDGVSDGRAKFDARASGTSSLDVPTIRAQEFKVSLAGTSHVSAQAGARGGEGGWHVGQQGRSVIFAGLSRLSARSRRAVQTCRGP